jgi:hypothetical protein
VEKIRTKEVAQNECGVLECERKRRRAERRPLEAAEEQALHALLRASVFVHIHAELDGGQRAIERRKGLTQQCRISHGTLRMRSGRTYNETNVESALGRGHRDARNVEPVRAGTLECCKPLLHRRGAERGKERGVALDGIVAERAGIHGDVVARPGVLHHALLG